MSAEFRVQNAECNAFRSCFGSRRVFSYFLHDFNDHFGLFEDHLSHAYFRFVDAAVYGCFDFGFQDVVDGEPQGFTSQSPGPRRISVSHRQGVELAAVRRRSTEDDNQIVPPYVIDRSLYFLLTFQVNGACRRSDEAVGHFQDHVGPGAAGTLADRRSRNPVSLAQGDHLLALQVHSLNSFRSGSFRS